MRISRTYPSEGLPRIASPRAPLSPEEEAQLEWLFCLASSLERIQTSLAVGLEPEQAQVDARVLLAHHPFLEPAAAVFPVFQTSGGPPSTAA